MATETVVDLANEAIAQKYVASTHLLKQSAEARVTDDACSPEVQDDASWEQLPEEQHSDATYNVDVYLDDFISVVYGGPKERRQLLWHLFHKIDKAFLPNEETNTDRK